MTAGCSSSARAPITIYTDGACSGNPGPGGYAAVLKCGAHRKEVSGGYRCTTNNRMELMACIEALKRLRNPSDVILYSDSRYVVDAMTKGWARRWREKGWRKSGNERALNPDLWEELLKLCERHRVEFRWLRGHDGDEENELCDLLAVEASRRPGLPEDPGYRPGEAGEE